MGIGCDVGFALPTISTFHFLVQSPFDRGFVQAPTWSNEIVGGRFTADPFDDCRGGKDFQEIDQRVNVVMQPHQLDLTTFDLLLERRVFDAIQVVDFDGVDF